MIKNLITKLRESRLLRMFFVRFRLFNFGGRHDKVGREINM